MNNHGSISLKHSSEISRKFQYPISATANSTINIRNGNLIPQKNIILTEATASNASVAAARATAKAASMATSTITNNRNYLSNYDPLEKSVTFQISTLCTIQRNQSDNLVNNSDCVNIVNSDIRTDTVKSLNHKMYNNNEIENIHVPIKSRLNKGTKFEKLRRELESLELERNLSYNNVNDCHMNNYKSSRLSDYSICSNISTLSSCKSDQPLHHQPLLEPLNYFSDNSNTNPYEKKLPKSNIQKNSFLNTDTESSDISFNIKKYKISDLKKHNKISNSNCLENFKNYNFNNIKDLTNNNDKEINSLHCVKTIPGISYVKSYTINEDLGALFSSSSLLPETDIDSGTQNESYFFPQTDFYGDQTTYGFEKTRSLGDLRKNSDVDYKSNISKAISIENFKNTNPAGESDLIKRLKFKAQSIQELRVADSLTKLNVPQWMNDFKLSCSQKIETERATPTGNIISFKSLKHHDSILSKYKYNSLPHNKHTISNKEQEIKKVLLPSSLYRSKSQNLVYFNPNKDSKLKNIKDENNKQSTSLKVLTENTLKNIISYPNNIENLFMRVNNYQIEQTYKNTNNISNKETEVNENENEIICQDKEESEFILNTLVNATKNQFLSNENLCESFRINPATLKLLLNVKRKTPNLNRDETYISSQHSDIISIENSVIKNENNNNYIICNYKICNKIILQEKKIDRGNCSCYNCYTYYCSKKCRNYDFSNHGTECTFNRIKTMLKKLKSSFTVKQLYNLSIFAKENYNKHNVGTLLIAFESCRAADDFLNGQLNRLMSQPYYLSRNEINKYLPLFKIINYNPQKEYLITLIISATLPMTSIELSHPTFKYSFKLEFTDNEIVETKLSLNDECHKRKNVENDLKIREKFFEYVINYFKEKNINLYQSHFMVYRKLEKYKNEAVAFESQTLFIKDPVTNSTVAYVINLNKEIVSKSIRNVTNKTNFSGFIDTNMVNKTITETEI